MRSMVSIVIAAAALAAAPATAGTYISYSDSTATFGNTQVTPVSFSDVIDLGSFGGFIQPGQAYRLSGTISTSYQSGNATLQNIDFSSVSVNGKDFTLTPSGQFEFGFVSDVAMGAANLLKISGSSGANASYAGTLNIAAVPEAATWAMMIIGFGFVGGVVRSRSRKQHANENGRLAFN